MAQCIFLGGTRVCSSSPYRVNGAPGRKFARLSKAMRKARRPAHQALDLLDIPEEQKQMAKNLMDVVLATTWNRSKADNARDIEKSVQLMLVDEVGNMKGRYTLVAY